MKKLMPKHPKTQTDVTQKLSSLRQEVHNLKIPSSTFAVIWTNTDKIHITERGGEAISQS